MSHRILLSIHHRLDPDSGAPGATLSLGESLRGLGNEVDYLSFDEMPRGLPERSLALLFPAFVAWRLRTREDLDVVDASTGDAWLWALLARRPRRARPVLIARSHGLEHLIHLATTEKARVDGRALSRRYRAYWGGYRLWEVAVALRAADLALFLNGRERDYAVERLGVEPSRARIVANGIPDAFLERAIKPAPDGESGRIGIAQVGGWLPVKGIDNSVASLTEILDRHPAVEVGLFGTGVPATEIHPSFPERLHTRIRVVPSFQRDSLPELLRDHQIFLFPSLAEGFGVALLEAMASGLAPVASAAEGPAMLVRDGKSGILVPPGDHAATVAALERLLTDRGLLERLRRGARESARPYTLGAVAKRTAELYEEALETRAARVAGR